MLHPQMVEPRLLFAVRVVHSQAPRDATQGARCGL
jgi:hypothetical protein